MVRVQKSDSNRTGNLLKNPLNIFGGVFGGSLKIG
jgi:hypothetical protein